MTRSTFVSAARQRRFEEDGVVEFPLFDAAQASELHDDVLALHQGARSGWHSSNESRDHAYRRRVHTVLSDLLAQPMAEILEGHRLFNTSLLIKWPGPGGEMGTHQDWSFVDETQYRSLTVWCPLVDVGSDNGALEVLPGSHRVLTHTRCSPMLPEDYEDPLGDLGEGDLVRVPLAAGTAVALDHGVAHRSPPNRTDSPRVAIAASFAPEEADLHHHYRDPQGRIWDFAIPDAAWFRSNDIGERPRGVPCTGRTVFTARRLSAHELLTRCRPIRPEAAQPDRLAQSARPRRSPISRFGELLRTRRVASAAPTPSSDQVDSNRPRTFQATALEGQFCEQGFLVVDVLDADGSAALRSAYDDLEHGDQWNSDFAPGFHTTMYDPRPQYRREVLALINGALSSALDRLLVDHRICLANFTVKLAGGAPVPGHLDWNFVDETRGSSVTVWCALQDITEEQGALTVVPGSHHQVDFIRPVNHRDYDRHTAVADRPAVPVPIRLGQAIVMDNRTVHGSSANQTDRTRLAAAAVMAPRPVPLHHYWVNADGDLVRLEVSPDFYLDYQIGQDPTVAAGIIDQRVLQGVEFA